jgi:hypothetical protein
MYHKKNNQNISQPCEMGTKKSVNHVKRVPEKKTVNHVKRVPEKNQSTIWKWYQKKTSHACEKGTRKKPVMHVERGPEKMEQLKDLSLLLIITKINVMYL